MDKKRSELQDKLHDHFIDLMADHDLNFGEDNSAVAMDFAEMAEEFLLARERSLLKEIEEPLKELYNKYYPDSVWDAARERNPACDAVDKALRIIEERLEQ